MNQGISSQGYYADETLILPNDEVDMEYFVKDRYTQITQNINQREVAIYPLVEIEIGQKYYTPNDPRKYRTVFRKVLPIGAVAAGGASAAVAHGITSLSRFTRIYGTASAAGPQYYMLPYADAAGTGNVDIVVTATTVTINGGATAPALTDAEVVLEYIKV